MAIRAVLRLWRGRITYLDLTDTVQTYLATSYTQIKISHLKTWTYSKCWSLFCLSNPRMHVCVHVNIHILRSCYIQCIHRQVTCSSPSPTRIQDAACAGWSLLPPVCTWATKTVTIDSSVGSTHRDPFFSASRQIILGTWVLVFGAGSNIL